MQRDCQTATSTLPVVASFEVHSSNILVVDACTIDSTSIATNYEVSDVVRSPFSKFLQLAMSVNHRNPHELKVSFEGH